MQVIVHFFSSCHALETAFLTRLFGVHTHQWQPPSRAVHVAAKIWTFTTDVSQSNESCVRELRANTG